MTHDTAPKKARNSIRVLFCVLGLMLALYLGTGSMLQAQTEADEPTPDATLPTATTSTTTETTVDPFTLRADAEAEQTARLEAVADERATLAPVPAGQSAVLTERTRTRITNLAANMSNRTEAAIARLAKIADRLERRVGKLEAGGSDTRAAAEAIAAARTELSTASTIMEGIDSDVHRFVHAHDPAGRWVAVSAIYDAAQSATKNAQVALRIAVNELKNAPPTQVQPTPGTTTDAE